MKIKKSKNIIIARNTLLHELGHYFDALCNSGLSGSYDFNQIYFSEVDNFLNTTQYNVDNQRIYTNVSNPIEYFACAYSCYISYPDDLRNWCPKTFEYIDNYMNSIEIAYGNQVLSK